MKRRYGFTRSDWALIWSHISFRLFLQFSPAQIEIERAGMEILVVHHGLPRIA